MALEFISKHCSFSKQPARDAGFELLRCGDVHPNPGPGLDPGPGPEAVDGNVNGGHEKRITKCHLQVISQNVRGLGESKKVRHLINRCYKLTKNASNSIFLFQETYVTKLDLLNYLWRGEHHVTMGNGNSLGCITLVTAPYKIVKSHELGQRGHVLVLAKDDVNKAEVIVANVYAPNGFDAEKLQFFENVFDLVEDLAGNYNCDKVLLGGDLNLVFNDAEVQNRAISAAEVRVSDAVKLMLNRVNLIDGWSCAAKRSFTWTSNRTGTPAFSTLDRVLFTKDEFDFAEMIADWSLSLSDHAAVVIKFKHTKMSQKPTFISRLDPRLLQDQDGKVVLDNAFQELFAQRLPTWDPHVSLEYTKMCIRTAANTANGTIKARCRDEEATLNVDINNVIEELADESCSLDRKLLLKHKLDDLRFLKRKLVEKIGAKLERRTARQWYNEGELSNKYFFNLLNRKCNDEITTILGPNGEEIRDPSHIEAEIKNFYKDLYENVPDEVTINDEFFRNIETVDRQAADEMSRMITVADLEETLRTCSDSAPGPDGIPYSFLKHFWPYIGPILINSWTHSLGTKELPPSHKVSYLRLIPKAGKDSRIINNLRPITLSNTDHKLITKTYARKMTRLVSDKICQEQTAYIPGRLINDNVRAMLMSIDLANVDPDVDGVIVSLDAKKAFDSVDHRYIRSCLAAFGLASFIPIFDVLYKDLISQIVINGKTIDGYRILKGVKQGDALSCIIFIICMEPLLRNLKENRAIEPIVSRSLDINVPKAYGYADDINVVMRNTPRGVREIFREYEIFSAASGLVLNADKTEILNFNYDRRVNDAFQIQHRGTDVTLTSQDQVKINGILMLQDTDRREELNVQKVVDAVGKLLKSWSTRTLTLLGKILIIKTYAISQVIYLMQSMSLCESSIKKIMTVIYKFLWNRNFDAARAPERIKRSIMLTSVSNGGFGMIDLKDVGDSIDLRSYGRMQVTKHPFLEQLKRHVDTGNFFKVEINVRSD